MEIKNCCGLFFRKNHALQKCSYTFLLYLWAFWWNNGNYSTRVINHSLAGDLIKYKDRGVVGSMEWDPEHSFMVMAVYGRTPCINVDMLFHGHGHGVAFRHGGRFSPDSSLLSFAFSSNPDLMPKLLNVRGSSALDSFELQRNTHCHGSSPEFLWMDDRIFHPFSSSTIDVRQCYSSFFFSFFFFLLIPSRDVDANLACATPQAPVWFHNVSLDQLIRQ